MFYRIPDEHRAPFELEIYKANLLSAKVTALVFLLSNLALTVIYNFGSKDNGFLFEMIFIVLFIITSSYYIAIDRLSRNIERHLRAIKVISYIFAEIVLTSAAAFSACNQSNAVYAIPYMALIFILSFCFYCESVKLFVTYCISQSAYILLSFMVNGANDLFFSSTILICMFVTVSYLLSRLIYRGKYIEYSTKIIIQEKNEQLSRLNAELMESNRLLKALSNTDSLTGLNNRRHMNEILQREWERCREGKNPLSLLMIDIDNFKALNDLFGHHVGDDCLQQIAALMKQILDSTDAVIARYGGEEFMVALPCTDETCAFNTAEQLRAGVEKHMFVWRGHGSEILITISVGVASVVPNDDYGITDLIYSADKSMYKAKKSKNQTVLLPVQKLENKQPLELVAKS